PRPGRPAAVGGDQRRGAGRHAVAAVRAPAAADLHERLWRRRRRGAGIRVLAAVAPDIAAVDAAPAPGPAAQAAPEPAHALPARRRRPVAAVRGPPEPQRRGRRRPAGPVPRRAQCHEHRI
ncbi:hypothetical protein IWQ57_002078, partial [Coemansia nantahalensis]